MSAWPTVPEPVFVAPHYDDVALSCGGWVSSIARTGSPVIVTVFGGEPSGNVPAFARFQHTRWKTSSGGTIAKRQAEDRCAALALGRAVQTIWLDYPDAIYRHSAYDSDDALFGSVVTEDTGLDLEIADSLTALDGSEYYVPMAIGNHVDHQLVYSAGIIMAQRGRTVWGYADLPYALNPEGFQQDGQLAGSEASRTCILDAQSLEQRWKAISCYRSQLPVVFRSYPDPRNAIERFLCRIGGGQAAEPFWLLNR